MTDLSEFIQIIKSDEKAMEELRDCFARKGTVMDVMTALLNVIPMIGLLRLTHRLSHPY